MIVQSLLAFDFSKVKLNDVYQYSLLASIIVVTLLLIGKSLRKSWFEPPGPTGIPILGYYPLIANDPVKGLLNVASKYEHVFSVNLLGEKYYFINSVEAAKEALTKGNLIADRPRNKFNSLSVVFGSKSFVNENTDAFVEHQKLILANLVAQGVRSIDHEEKVHNLLYTALGEIRDHGEDPQDIYETLYRFSSNVSAHLVLNERLDFNDPEVLKLRDNIRKFVVNLTDLDTILVGPVFKLFLTKLKKDNYKALEEAAKEMSMFWTSVAKRRQKKLTGDKTWNQSLLDSYLRKAEEDRREKSTIYEMDAIAHSVLPMFSGGAETTSTTLYHAINLMVLHPEVQQRVHKEIDEKIGSSRIFMSDEKILPYTRAVLAEIQRYTALIPLGFVRVNRVPVKVTDYVIPPNANLVVNLWSLSRDPRHFKNPNQFDPSNFLDEKGDFVKNESYMPFSYGKRMCIGYQVAEVSLFIGFATLLQQFSWDSPSKQEPVERVIFEGINRTLASYKVKASARSQA